MIYTVDIFTGRNQYLEIQTVIEEFISEGEYEVEYFEDSEKIEDSEDVIIIIGDFPLISGTIMPLIENHANLNKTDDFNVDSPLASRVVIIRELLQK